MHVDKFNEKDSRLYKVLFNMHAANEVSTHHGTPYPLVAVLKKEMPEVENATSIGHLGDWYAGDGVVSFAGNQIWAKGIFAGKDFFNVFSYQLIHENKSDILAANKNRVVLSQPPND